MKRAVTSIEKSLGKNNGFMTQRIASLNSKLLANLPKDFFINYLLSFL